ncbi:ubiquinone-binding COQ10-like protein, partial [Aspergillus ibericus CBS 121593]
RHLTTKPTPSPTFHLRKPSTRPTLQNHTTTTTTTTLLRPLTQTQTRPFLSSLLPGSSSSSSNNTNKRHVSATRTLPYPPGPLFQIISSVESYSSFLPFLTASTVTHRDPATNYPTRAFLTVGYGPLSETFTSKVICDEENHIVEAKSGNVFGVGKKDGQGEAGFPGADEGIFEYLSTRWELKQLGKEGEGTEVKLDIRFEFKSQLHAMLMGKVEGEMAGVMIQAFERRIRAVLGDR